MPVLEAVRPGADLVEGGPDALDRLAQPWRELADEGWNQYPFCRPECILGYARSFRPGVPLLVATAHGAGRLRAVLPLFRERGRIAGVPVRFLRSASAGMARFDIVRTTDDYEAAAAISRLWGVLRNCRGWDAIEFRDVPESAAVLQLMAEAEKDGFGTGYRPAFWTPYITLDDCGGRGEDPWLARTSSHFRGAVRRKTRRLSEQGKLTLERLDHVDREAFDLYRALEQATWKGERQCAIGSDGPSAGFFEHLAHSAAQFGYLSLYLLRLDQRVVAGSFGFTYRGKFFFVRCAFHPDFYPYSPGHILINWILRDCAARRVSEFDFVGEGHDWKRPWMRSVREHGFCYIFRRGLMGGGLRALKFTVVPKVRELLRRPAARNPLEDDGSGGKDESV